jgi:autophagy-related protein 18
LVSHFHYPNSPLVTDSLSITTTALSPSSDNSYLAYPNYIDHSLSSSTTSSSNTTTNTTTNTGTVTIFDTISLSVINIIQAHKAPISILSINPTGTLLATASDKGTVIRVFALPNGEKLHEFRRGSYPAKIYSLSFNATSTLLCVSSDTETVHIFKLSKSSSSTSMSSPSSSYRGGRASGMDFDEETVGRYYNHRPDLSSDTASIDSSSSPYTTHSNTTSSSSPSTTSPNNKKSILSNSLRKRSINLGRNLAGSVGGFLPGAVKGVWEPQRDFAFLKLPVPGVRSVVAMNSSVFLPFPSCFLSFFAFFEVSSRAAPRRHCCPWHKHETAIQVTSDPVNSQVHSHSRIEEGRGEQGWSSASELYPYKRGEVEFCYDSMLL